MKKLFITAAIATMFSVTAFADGGKKATTTSGEEKVSYAVLEQFKSDFESAVNPVWTVTSSSQKVSFTQNNVNYTAFYDSRDNEFWGVSQEVAFVTVTSSMKTKIAKSYKDYEVTGVTKFQPQDGEEPVIYFVNVKSADSQLVLTLAPDGEVKNIEKVK
jgi:heptaprenylglyceryl phosphate synthase